MKTIALISILSLSACAGQVVPEPIPAPLPAPVAPSCPEVSTYTVNASGAPIGERSEPDNTRATALCNTGDTAEIGWCTGATMPLVSAAVPGGWQCTEDNPKGLTLSATVICLHNR